MTADEYKQRVAALPFGKRLPTAIHVYRESELDCGSGLNELLAAIEGRYGLGEAFNVIKFRTDEPKVSFLSYPGFMEEVHPALRHAVTIDLVTGKTRHIDYADNHNPPLLHRKESFLPAGHPANEKFSGLTRAEEGLGLYEDTTTIGFKLNWERFLTAKGFEIRGHSLYAVAAVEQEETGALPLIERHKTALTRYELSKPVKTLLEYGMLKTGTSFFDYGCGQGHDADGWDPVHLHDAVKKEADVVNMGYVLNVIEDHLDVGTLLGDGLVPVGVHGDFPEP